ncbi:MAG: S41 family peptidase [Planctomycetota bacterium]
MTSYRDGVRALTCLLLCALPASAQRASPKTAPFQRVDLEGDVVTVLVERRTYRLVAVDGIETARLLAACREQRPDAWRTRFRLQLPEVIASLRGQPPGATVSLVLSATRSGERVVIEKAPLTRANYRRLFWQQQGFAGPAPPMQFDRRLSRAAAARDFAQLERAVRQRFAYFDWRRRTVEPLALPGDIVEPTAGQLAQIVARWLAPFGDPNTQVQGLRDTLAGRFLPFELRPVGNRFVALQNGQLLNFQAPFVRALDARRPREWLKAVAMYLPHGNEAYMRYAGPAYLNQVEALRPFFQAKKRGSVWVTLDSADGQVRIRTEHRLVPEPPTAAPRPKPQMRVIEGGIGYVPLPTMESEEAFERHIAPILPALQETQAAVLDLRGNNSSRRGLLRVLLPVFLKEPVVSQVARVRRSGPEDPEGYLADFDMHPRAWKGWNQAQRAAIAAFAETFRPAWATDDARFSDWHYLVPQRTDRGYDKPLVVLVDGGTRNSAEVLAFALQHAGRAVVVGEASGGSDGGPVTLTLENSRLRVTLSTIASYRPDGKLYLGSSVQPSLLRPRDPVDWTGAADAQLQAALERLR